MPDGSGRRFALEALFLVLLALGAGLADLRPLLIAAVMAAGWVLVALIEAIAWRARARRSAFAPDLAGPAPVRRWDVAEIIAPQAEEPEPEDAEVEPVPEPEPVAEAADEAEPEEAAVTTILPPEPDGPVDVPKPGWRTRFRRSQ